VLYCINAAWCFSNQQLFRNKVVPMTKTDFFFPESDHKLTQFFTQLTPGTVFLGALLVPILYSLVSYASKQFKKWRARREGDSRLEDDEVFLVSLKKNRSNDQSLPPYSKALRNF